MRKLRLVSALARSILAGEPTVEQITARCTRTLGRSWRWLKPLAQRYVASFAGKTRPRHRDVIRFLHTDRGFEDVCSKYFDTLSVAQWLTASQKMQPVAAAQTWPVPAIESPRALGDWLSVDLSELEWFADLRGLTYKSKEPRVSHYHYRILAKPSGSIRLIEAPKSRLKALQREILARILDHIPPHPAVHGFVKGRSIKTFVAPHIGRRVVLRMDLRNFFPTFPAARIQALFRTVGYPEAVADLLAGMCTNAVPRRTWKEAGAAIDPAELAEVRTLYARPHLPQGAPTSPALANLCTYRVDCRLNGLAKATGARYTRYADDLAFSGDETFERCAERFSIHAAAILLEEGFLVHHRKTRVMRQGVRQYLTGLVANQRLNVVRADFDRLKATLANCVRLGPASQNRDAHPNFRSHLEGRIGFVETINPAKAKRLRAIFAQIEW